MDDSRTEQNDSLIQLPIRRYRAVLIVMVMVFIGYNYVVYTCECENPLPPVSEQAMRGQQLWQSNNCTACHQLYGLGGYLGPDLTNVVSRPNKGPVYVKAFLNSGVKAMPKFDFTPEEQEDIVAFLEHVDQTGFFPNNEAQLQRTGWIKLKYKSSNSDDE